MELGVARVHAFGREGDEEVLVDLEPGRRQLGQQHLTREARKVVLSSTTICGRRMRGNNMSAASRMKELSDPWSC